MHAVILYSPALICYVFFAKLFFAVSCKTFPKGVTVIEILTLRGDSWRTKCSGGGSGVDFTIVSIC